MPLKKEKLSMFDRLIFAFAGTPISCHGPTILLLRQRVAIGGGGSSLSLGLCNNIGLVNSALNNLLLFRVEVLGKVFIQRRLLLLELCCLLVLTKWW